MMPGLDSIIASASRGGWDWFEQLDPRVKEMVEIKQAKAEEDRRAIASAWADFYKTPGGRKALEFLFGTTLMRTVYFVQLGLDPASMGAWGAFREGQNALAQEIARQVAAGLGEEAPKPRDV